MANAEYSPGLEGIVAGETALSTIGETLRYRGYAVEELAEHASFEEVAYLLLYGELPTVTELDQFRQRLGKGSFVPHPIINFLRQIPNTTPMMDIMRTGASLVAHWDPDVADNSREAELRKAERLLAQLPVIMAAAFRLRQGMEPIGPDPKRSLADNVLHMLFRRDHPDDRTVRAMDVTLILYAEHEFNASTFTARAISSTQSDMHSAVTGAIGALKGALHGGANERVMAVLDQVGKPENAETWVRDALSKKVRIMGFGHRIYKDEDPRATYLKPLCRKLAREIGQEPLEDIADTIERVVREEKGFPPNADWPSARLYHYLGLAVELYTPLFVISRVAGWCAHIIEQHGNNRLIRPKAIYIGREDRSWRPIGERG